MTLYHRYAAQEGEFIKVEAIPDGEYYLVSGDMQGRFLKSAFVSLEKAVALYKQYKRWEAFCETYTSKD